MIVFAGCSDHRDDNAIDLETALKNTENGDYPLIAVSDADGARFVSFQKSANHKRQCYFEAEDRNLILEKVTNAVREARKHGHSVATIGVEDILEESQTDKQKTKSTNKRKLGDHIPR